MITEHLDLQLHVKVVRYKINSFESFFEIQLHRLSKFKFSIVSLTVYKIKRAINARNALTSLTDRAMKKLNEQKCK